MQVRITRARKGIWLLACITAGGALYYEKIVSFTLDHALVRARKLIGSDENGTIIIDY